VLDGYHFDPGYQRQIREAGHRLLVIDDAAHLDHYYADMVLNQNINAERLHYPCEPDTRLLLGTRYALLRSEFLVWRGWQRETPEVARKVLVTLGGGDPDNQTLKVMQALRQVSVGGLEVIVVVGASNPHFQELQSAIRNSLLTIRLVHNATNMPELMAWADVAISAGGSTCWELAFMGLPAVILVLAKNQQGIAAGLEEAGVAVNLGWHTEVSAAQVASALLRLFRDRDLRWQMDQQGRELVDGSGIERVVELLQA
jgi:UDP-2,4-diacetamido-2,4,6-trideoxy-beta-L-altropyranose hydrolase